MVRVNLRDAIARAYLMDEEALAERVLEAVRPTPAEKAATETLARDLVSRMRRGRHRRSGVDWFTQEYALSSGEGAVLMCLAEALLRVPDAETADRLIRDKLAGHEWERHLGRSESLFVNAATWALMLSGGLIGAPGEDWDFEGIWRSLIGRLGEPVIRRAVAAAVRLLGRQFVLGRTIKEALAEAQPLMARGYRLSFDMLGEAAHTRPDADRYYAAYRDAILAVAGAQPRSRGSVFARPSISIKLTALHPRYEFVQRNRVMVELLGPLTQLCEVARDNNLGLTIDAEESERLELTLDVFEALGNEPSLKDWEGLGIAIQGYQKRALPLVDWLAELSERQARRIPVRLVKGAYWDSEIKHAQEMALVDYPVFTRKEGTDVSYLACARALLAKPGAFFPQFATHNAHTLAAVQAFAGRFRDYEFQRLHGMGEALYELYEEVIKPSETGTATRIYAPVGGHEDLLPYLMRRLLENGANTSFVNRLARERAPVETIIADPIAKLASASPRRNPRIPKPGAIFPDRPASPGLLLSDPAQSAPLLTKMQAALLTPAVAHPIIGGAARTRTTAPRRDPADRRRVIGEASVANEDDARDALTRAYAAQRQWDTLGGSARADLLERAADDFEAARPDLMALIVREGGRTVADALSELREAVDLLRYYARLARIQFGNDVQLPGPTGEDNVLSLHGRGVFACIAPWNFPLSIFVGQIAGALASGNTVIAKPAAQTPIVAAAAVRLLLAAGLPDNVLHLLPGDGARIGGVLFPDSRLAGVALTGSTETAVIINRALAARNGALATFIAETGGLNAMIVDSTALPEQVTSDVIASAFNTAGQRCSSLRVLFVQEDVASRILALVLGTMDELKLGDPLDLATDIGPVIDEQARDALAAHAQRMDKEGKLLRALELPAELEHGVFFPPTAYQMDSMSRLNEEVFGPILHVVPYSAGRLDKVCEAIAASGYGLTLGLHSRISATADFVRRRVPVGNFYVNRSQIGAVVEAQPFGGQGLSGTGPKAGGPHYLRGFAVERCRSINTAAAGGNATLLTLDED